MPRGWNHQRLFDEATGQASDTQLQPVIRRLSKQRPFPVLPVVVLLASRCRLRLDDGRTSHVEPANAFKFAL
jgi:hypothetical protein